MSIRTSFNIAPYSTSAATPCFTTVSYYAFLSNEQIVPTIPCIYYVDWSLELVDLLWILKAHESSFWLGFGRTPHIQSSGRSRDCGLSRVRLGCWAGLGSRKWSVYSRIDQLHIQRERTKARQVMNKWKPAKWRNSPSYEPCPSVCTEIGWTTRIALELTDREGVEVSVGFEPLVSSPLKKNEFVTQEGGSEWRSRTPTIRSAVMNSQSSKKNGCRQEGARSRHSNSAFASSTKLTTFTCSRAARSYPTFSLVTHSRIRWARRMHLIPARGK
jgi:hypothetical protein